MKSEKSLFSRTILSCVTYLIMGMILVAFPDIVADMIAYVFAILILLVGIVMVAFYAKEEVVLPSNRKTLSFGLILVCAAVYCLININFLVSIIPTVLGLIAVMNGLGKFQYAIDLFRTHNDGKFVLFLALAVITFGIIILINPFAAVTTFYRVVGIALLLGGITDIIAYLILAKKAKLLLQDKEAIDVTEDSK